MPRNFNYAMQDSSKNMASPDSKANNEHIENRLSQFDMSKPIPYKVTFDDDDDDDEEEYFDEDIIIIESPASIKEEPQDNNNETLQDDANLNERKEDVGIETNYSVNKCIKEELIDSSTDNSSKSETPKDTSIVNIKDKVVLEPNNETSGKNNTGIKRNLDDKSINPSKRIRCQNVIINRGTTESESSNNTGIPPNLNNTAVYSPTAANHIINLNYTKKLLQSLSEHLLCIIYSYNSYIRCSSKPNQDPAVTQQAWQYFKRIKNHYFNLSYVIVKVIIREQTSNNTFMTSFLEDTGKLAKHMNKTVCLQSQIKPLLIELLQWTEGTHSTIKHMILGETSVLRQHLAGTQGNPNIQTNNTNTNNNLNPNYGQPGHNQITQPSSLLTQNNVCTNTNSSSQSAVLVTTGAGYSHSPHSQMPGFQVPNAPGEIQMINNNQTRQPSHFKGTPSGGSYPNPGYNEVPSVRNLIQMAQNSQYFNAARMGDNFPLNTNTGLPTYGQAQLISAPVQTNYGIQTISGNNLPDSTDSIPVNIIPNAMTASTQRQPQMLPANPTNHKEHANKGKEVIKRNNTENQPQPPAQDRSVLFTSGPPGQGISITVAPTIMQDKYKSNFTCHYKPTSQEIIPVQNKNLPSYWDSLAKKSQGNFMETIQSNLQNVMDQTNVETMRSMSRDSGFMSPDHFNSTSDTTIGDAGQERLAPVITHVTSLNPNQSQSYNTNAMSHRCSVCGNIARDVCVCHRRAYCSASCQSSDLKIHMLVCKMVSQT